MKIWMRWIPAIIWMLIIFYLSHQPAQNLESVFPFFQNFFPFMKSFNGGHFVAYFILAISFYWGLGRRYTNFRGKLFVVFLCIVYGLTDEYHQSFIVGRHPDMADLRNDTIGAAIAMIILSFPPLHRLYLKWVPAKKY